MYMTLEYEPQKTVIQGRPRFRALRMLLGVLGALGVGLLAFSSSALADLPASCSPSAPGVLCTYRYTGAEQTFTVPSGVDRVHVDAIGGRGFGPNGNGAEVTADIAVTPGETLYAEVGGNGGAPSNTTGLGGAGGWNGGGSAGDDEALIRGYAGVTSFLGGGGGGASDVRTCSRTDSSCDTLASRLLVAAGGGGFGGSSAGGYAGTPNGEDGQSIDQASAPGRGATTTAAGAGGAGGDTGFPGSDGALGAGGNGGATAFNGTSGGGGGGGGYYGGGGGGADLNSLATGGGGGSSYGPAGATFALASVFVAPSVMISYTVGTAGIAASGTVPGVYNGVSVNVQFAAVQRCTPGAGTFAATWQVNGVTAGFKEASGNSQSDSCTNYDASGYPQSLSFAGSGTSGGSLSGGDFEGPGAPTSSRTVAFTINTPSGGTLVVGQASPGPLQGSPGRLQPFVSAG